MLMEQRSKRRMSKTIIFDMDGVLIDSEALHFETARRVCECQGGVLSKADYGKYVGMPSVPMWSDWSKRYGWECTVNSLIAWELEEQERLLVQEGWKIPLVSGVADFLSFCQSRGATMAVASSASASFIGEMMREHKLTDFFAALISVERVRRGKPEPDVFIYAAGRLNVPVSECMVIEDSANGARAAKLAGMKVVGFVNPNSGQQDFSMADLVVHSYGELAEKIEMFERD